MADDVLETTLLLAVPMWVEKLGGCTSEQRQARAARCAQMVVAHGDALQFKGKDAKGRRLTTQAFNALAEGLACAAYQPGEVTFAGRHWCVGSAHGGVQQAESGPCAAEGERECVVVG